MTHNELTLLDDLLNVEDGLSRWDIEFIDGLDQAWRDSELTRPPAYVPAQDGGAGRA